MARVRRQLTDGIGFAVLDRVPVERYGVAESKAIGWLLAQLMGQVVEVSEATSRALLVTDSTHSIPVQVNRNGVRAIAEGTGSLGRLEIHHVSATTDIQQGDLLVSSGLGGRFPVGYPVAEVTRIERDPGQAFARVEARPMAAMDRSRHVLLVFTQRQD